MPRARYKSLVDAFAEGIRSGQMPPGLRLPTHRQLAAEHGLALVTASRVYAELENMGLVSGEAGRGTFVREIGLALLRYQPHAGRLHERAAIARHLLGRGLAVAAEQVLVVSGAQHGLAVTMMALLKPGDVIAVDALTYSGFKALAETLHLEIAAIPLTADGPDLEFLHALCRKRQVRAVYSMPTLHNPLGWVMPQAARERLVAIARQHNLMIIEDAAYAFLVEDAPPPVASLAPERTVYVGGLSKSVATGLRVGFVAAPVAWMKALERSIMATTWNVPGVMSAIAVGWIEDGTVARLEAQKREDAQARQALAAQVLKGLAYTCHPSSYFLWLPLAEDMRADQVAMSLQHEGVCVSTAEPFAVSAHAPHALRLALGSVSLPELCEALRKVRKVVAW
ncbi:GntR family transcriptional regulator [Pseudomonas fluorescens ABAC62]|nr:GntR family transcriptional regulator [Pseudomonas fluorescens ABAC62]